MAERDNKGRFVKGHKPLGKPFAAGGSAVELACKGQKASTEAKRARKTWREELDDILVKEVTSKGGTTATKNRVILEQQVNKALLGDTKAAKFVGEIIGDYKHNVDVQMSVPIQLMDDGLD